MLVALVILIALYLAVLFAAAWFSVHPPRSPVFISPGSLGLPQEDVSFTSRDGTRLVGWWVQGEPGRPVAVMSHGYIMCRSELVPLARTLYLAGCSCLLYDFRAHGKSSGKRSGLGWIERDDVRAAVDYARSRQPNVPVILVGSSMGSAASAMAWGDDPTLADGLVLDSCYSRLLDATSGWWRFVGGKLLAFLLAPCAWLCRPMVGFSLGSVDVSRHLANVPGDRVLILHGDADNLALPSEAERNAAALKPKPEIVWFEGCGHSEGRWLQPARFEGAVVPFVERIAQSGRASVRHNEGHG